MGSDAAREWADPMKASGGGNNGRVSIPAGMNEQPETATDRVQLRGACRETTHPPEAGHGRVRPLSTKCLVLPPCMCRTAGGALPAGTWVCEYFLGCNSDRFQGFLMARLVERWSNLYQKLLTPSASCDVFSPGWTCGRVLVFYLWWSSGTSSRYSLIVGFPS